MQWCVGDVKPRFRWHAHIIEKQTPLSRKHRSHASIVYTQASRHIPLWRIYDESSCAIQAQGGILGTGMRKLGGPGRSRKLVEAGRAGCDTCCVIPGLPASRSAQRHARHGQLSEHDGASPREQGEPREMRGWAEHSKHSGGPMRCERRRDAGVLAGVVACEET